MTGIFMAVCGAAAFGTLAIFAKYAFREGAEPISLLAGRYLVAALLLLAFGFGSDKRTVWVGRSTTIRLMLLGAIGYAGESSLFFAALDRAPAGVVELVFYSYPIWTSVLAILGRLERLSVRLLVALGLGSLGVITIFSVPLDSSSGLLFALAAAVAVAFYLVAAQVVTRDATPYASAFWTAVGASGALLVVSAIRTESVPAGALLPMLALGVATAFAFLAMYGAIARIGSSRTAIANMFEPITTIVLAAILLNEAITARVLLGGALVISTLPVLAFTRRVVRE